MRRRYVRKRATASALHSSNELEHVPRTLPAVCPGLYQVVTGLPVSGLIVCDSVSVVRDEDSEEVYDLFGVEVEFAGCVFLEEFSRSLQAVN